MMSRNNSTPDLKMEAPESGVAVRMYNPGFGDCFLLAFRGEDDKARYMLIDCGVHHNYTDGKDKIRKVVEDIAAVTDKHLHVVVATHEHTDHLYGFKHAEDIFKDFTIDELWLAWTEDPDDPVAKKLKLRWEKKKKALAFAIHQIKPLNGQLAETLGEILFEDPDAFTAARKKDTQLDFLREKTKKELKESKDFRRPGEAPLTLNGVKGVKVYVLGPPVDIERIKELETEEELYSEHSDMDEGAAFAAAVLAAEGVDSKSNEDSEFFDRSFPFDNTSIIPKDEARKHKIYGEFFQEHYGFPRGISDGPNWRRIDNEWLNAAGSLALKIQNKTNNTSLVLAIELTETQPRKVLLFAADAQVGNWRSWEKLCWPGEGQDGRTVNAEDLLRRTVLYKVGHHGSHNATLRKKGLELMDSPDLVAMIPVDEKWAKDRKKPWMHPAKKVLDRLIEKTKGRIIRTDKIPFEKPEGATATESEWKAFLDNLKTKPNDPNSQDLWIQFTVTE